MSNNFNSLIGKSCFIVHYLANELTKRHTFYGILPLAILALVTLDPYAYFLHVPVEVRLAAVATIVLFIIKTYDDPMFLELREQCKRPLD